jgi:hypothetical protein
MSVSNQIKMMQFNIACVQVLCPLAMLHFTLSYKLVLLISGLLIGF